MELDANMIGTDHALPGDTIDLATCSESIVMAAQTEAAAMTDDPALLDLAMVDHSSQPGAEVLVVGHDPVRRSRLCALLDDEPQIDRVGHVAGDWRALERVRAEHPEFVLLDLSERLGGMELLLKIREHSPHSTLLVASPAAASSAAPAACALGATRYFQRRRGRSSQRLATVVARYAGAAA